MSTMAESQTTAPSIIHTAPGDIVIRSNTSDEDKVFVVRAYPREVAEIPISISDDLNHTTKAIFSAVWSGNMSSLDPKYAYVSTDEIRVLGNPNSSLQIYLNSIGDRNWHVRFLVNHTECPPGLILLPAIVDPNNRSNSSLEFSEGGEWEKGELGEVAQHVSN